MMAAASIVAVWGGVVLAVAILCVFFGNDPEPRP